MCNETATGVKIEENYAQAPDSVVSTIGVKCQTFHVHCSFEIKEKNPSLHETDMKKVYILALFAGDRDFHISFEFNKRQVADKLRFLITVLVGQAISKVAGKSFLKGRKVAKASLRFTKTGRPRKQPCTTFRLKASSGVPT